ncbi:MAG: hypothetical protein ACKVS9_19295 [Phycisphaerae bacterium]
MLLTRLSIVGILLTLVGGAFAQDSPPAAEPPKTPVPTEGFWPTRTMLDRIMDRISDEMTDQYEFDDEQKERTRELLKLHIPRFMEQNRAEIQTLMNEFIEVQIHEEAPTVEGMSVWAQRMLPIVDKLSVMTEELTGDIREFMTDEQAVQLDSEFAAFTTGVGFLRGKVGEWSEGGFDPERDWTKPGPERRKREREEERRMQAEMEAARQEARVASGRDEETAPVEVEPARGATSKPASKPTDEWEQYTVEFAARYEFNGDQLQKAISFLKAKQAERDRYLTRVADDISKVTRMAADAKTDEEKKEAKDAGDKINAPIERIFQQLKDRLDTLPTRAQRQAAARREKPVSSQPAETSSAPAESGE